MRGDKRLGYAIVLVAVALAVWIALWTGIIWLILEPEHRAIAASLAGVILPMLGLAWLFAVIGMSAGLGAIFRGHMLAPARLLERARTLLAGGTAETSRTGSTADAPSAGIHVAARSSIAGSTELRALAQAIEALAGQRDELQRDIAAQVEMAARTVQQERNRLAALMFELTQSVVACNLDGRILLYNPRARQQFRPLSDAPGLAGGAELIGIGRSIHNLLDRDRIAHGVATLRARIARRDPDASTHFVTATRGGHLLRVQMAPVRSVSDAADSDSDADAVAGTGTVTSKEGSPDRAPAQDVLAGFVLVLDNVTAQFEEAAARDQALLRVTETGRASLASIENAIDRIAQDTSPATQARQLSLMRDEIDAMNARIQDLVDATTTSIRERWPLEALRADDLLAVVARSVESLGRCRVTIEPVKEPFWIKADSFGLGQALGYLTQRLADEFEVESVRLGISLGTATTNAPAPAQLDLRWRGSAMSTETVMNWELDPMRTGNDTSPLSVRDIVARHGGAMGFERDRARHEATFRFMLPTALDSRDDDAGGQKRDAPRSLNLQDARPEYFDFDLFDLRLQDGALETQPLEALTYTVFDTETTGLEPANGDEIIQIGAARIVNGRLLIRESFEQLIDPGRPIPAASIPIHGITEDMVRNQPRIADVLPSFHRFAEDSVLVAHNAAFDMRFLQLKEAATGIAFRQPVLDTLLLSALVHPNQSSHRLDAIAERFDIRIIGRHTALGDAIVTAQVLLRLVPLLQAMGIRTLRDAREASQKTWYARLNY